MKFDQPVTHFTLAIFIYFIISQVVTINLKNFICVFVSESSFQHHRGRLEPLITYLLRSTRNLGGSWIRCVGRVRERSVSWEIWFSSRQEIKIVGLVVFKKMQMFV